MVQTYQLAPDVIVFIKYKIFIIDLSYFYRGFTLHESELIDAAKILGPDCLRTGTQHMFEHLNDLDIPILVFSAGLGDSVVAILKANNVFLPNVEVVF